MELISGQLQCVEEASYQLADRCNYSIQLVYVLPYEHDLAHYRYFFIPIMLQSIDAHWKMLSMDVHGFNDERAQPNRTSHVVEILDVMDPHMREHMIDRFIDVADPSQSTVRALRITRNIDVDLNVEMSKVNIAYLLLKIHPLQDLGHSTDGNISRERETWEGVGGSQFTHP
ncbi:hypothetical protein Acr_11g0010970 [Actinidia rufa]|uniref:Uncharacterized protein n=1 Tax=Actinidia rufa TaxID=165716 RepID=A0A7J0FDN0_9ERIC|nr:hypothetical protein Acr_11g0010970 [Actinidia rufa]